MSNGLMTTGREDAETAASVRIPSVVTSIALKDSSSAKQNSLSLL